MWQIAGIAKRKRESKARANLFASFEFIVFRWAKEHDIWWWTKKKPRAKSKRKEEIFDWNWKISHTVPAFSLSLFRLPNALRLRSYRVRRFLRVKNDEQRKGGLKKIYCLFKLFYCENVEFSQPVCGDRARQTEKNESYWNESAQWTVCEIWTRRSSHWRCCPPTHRRNVKSVRLSLGFKCVVLSLFLAPLSSCSPSSNSH